MRTNLLPPTSRTRGAARLSAIWVIMAAVIALLMAVFAFIAQDRATKEELAKQQAIADAAEARAEVTALNREQRPVSERFGFTPDAISQISDAEAAKALLDQAKASFPDTDAVETYEDIIPVAIQAYQTKLGVIGEKDQRISDLESQLKAEREARSAAVSEKDDTIRDLQTQLTDITSTKDSEIARLESANTSLTQQINALTDEKVAAADAQRDAERLANRTQSNLDAERIRFNGILDDIKARSEKADGAITAADERLGIGFINLVAGDRLSEGTVFRIVSGVPNADKDVAKAFALVTDVGPEISEVKIYDVADPVGQPVVAGDTIYNPLYEPKGERNAVLIGTISGIYNREEAVNLLAEIGITVQDEISHTTNFVITGGPLFVDEDGEPLEEPKPVSDLPEYADAVDRGLVVIPMREVTQYFRR